VLAAKQDSHRPGIAPASGLRAGSNDASIVTADRFQDRRFLPCGSLVPASLEARLRSAVAPAFARAWRYWRIAAYHRPPGRWTPASAAAASSPPASARNPMTLAMLLHFNRTARSSKQV